MYTLVTNRTIVANFPNAIIDNKHFMYTTQQSDIIEKHNEKVRKLLEGGYEIKLAVRFPQVRYENPSYFYIGNASISMYRVSW